MNHQAKLTGKTIQAIGGLFFLLALMPIGTALCCVMGLIENVSGLQMLALSFGAVLGQWCIVTGVKLQSMWVVGLVCSLMASLMGLVFGSLIPYIGF